MAVQDIANADAAVGEFCEVAGGRLDRCVSEPGLDLLDRDVLVGERCGVVAAQRVRVRQALWDSCHLGVAAHQLGQGLLGYRAAAAVTCEAREDDVLVAKASADPCGCARSQISNAV